MTASSIAHELKQPLSLLLLKSNRLAKDCNSKAITLEQVSSISEEIGDLAQQMVDSTKAMSLVLGKMLSHSESVDLSKVLLGVIDSFAFSFDDAGIQLDGVGIRHGIVVRGIQYALSIAIRNVIRNAIDELSSCFTTDRIISVTLERHPDSIVLKVGDSGNGYRASTASTLLMNTTKSDGWGIGLNNVDCIMKCHSGRLLIGSSPLGGAEFSLVFPRSL
jgi:C4-dicarboxylate-specific signal transduction histidine kinase